MQETRQRGGDLTVSGCMAESVLGKHFVEGIMNKQVYVNLIDEHEKSSAEER